MSASGSRLLADLPIDIAKALRRGRLTKRLSQPELADSAGIARSTVSAIENGHQQPSLRTLRALDAALGQPVESFLEKSA